MSRLDLGVGYVGHDMRQFSNLGLPLRRMFPDGLSPIAGSARPTCWWSRFRKWSGSQTGRGSGVEVHPGWQWRSLVHSGCFAIRSLAHSPSCRLGPCVLRVTTRICGRDKWLFSSFFMSLSGNRSRAQRQLKAVYFSLLTKRQIALCLSRVKLGFRLTASLCLCLLALASPAMVCRTFDSGTLQFMKNAYT